MAKCNPGRGEILDKSVGCFIVLTFADGTQQRELIVKLSREKRKPPRPCGRCKLTGVSDGSWVAGPGTNCFVKRFGGAGLVE